jgi:hypothetical protein
MNTLQFECPVCFNPTMADLEAWEDLPKLMDRIEKTIVLAVWEKNARNGAATARELKIPFHAFRHLHKKHNLASEKVSHLNCDHG